MKESTKNEIIKVFWIFIIGSVFGSILETIVCLLEEGHYEVRQGVIYGPFIPVYGAGAVLFYLILPKVLGITVENSSKTSIIKAFLFTALFGGMVEYLFSYCQECLFGTVSWEYSNMYVNLNGRTSLLHCIYWGICGILFTKFIYPHTKSIKDFSNIGKTSKAATIVFIVFMVFNIVISVLAGQRQYARKQNIEPRNRIDKIMDKYYPDSIMDIIFSNKQYTQDQRGSNEEPASHRIIKELEERAKRGIENL